MTDPTTNPRPDHRGRSSHSSSPDAGAPVRQRCLGALLPGGDVLIDFGFIDTYPGP